MFSSLTGEAEEVLPESYRDLKRSIIGDEANQAALRRSWASLSKRLAVLADDVEKRQQAVRLKPDHDSATDTSEADGL